MSYNQNTGFSGRPPISPRGDGFAPSNSGSSIYTQRPLQQGDNREPGHQPNSAYRSQRYPPQANFDELGQRKEVLSELLREFGDRNSRVVFESNKKEEYSKRLRLL